MKAIFAEDNLNIFLKPYEIFITSCNSGMIEFIPDTVSVDGLKKKLPKGWTLKTFYENYFGENILDA